MKTVISLPDDLFRAAERLARESRRSRSQLYADALADYVRRHADDSVTTDMNRVVDQLGEDGADLALTGAARRTLMRSEW
ncbi:MAG: ChpI protein [Spirochaetaceae bacterium]|nr:ChpI protein [Spirochaetaceae bacterium]